MKLHYCVIGLLCLILKGYSQQINPLTIGDLFPGASVKIINQPALQSSLSVLSNKLVILDFMATNCSSCIKALPSFDSLQRKYGDKIQIFLVTSQPSEKVKPFIQKHAGLGLPMICGDSLLEKYFPHRFISHEVWIKNSLVKAITGPDYVTGKNIETVLSGSKINWPEKRDQPPFDYSKTLLKEDTESNTTPMFYTTVSKYIAAAPPKFISSSDSIKKIKRTVIMNMPIVELYLYLFNIALPKSRVKLVVKDSSAYFFSEKYGNRNAWKREHCFCYEAILPTGSSKEYYRDKMVADLDFYFEMKATWDTVATDSYELRAIDSSGHLLSKEASENLAKKEESFSLSVATLLSLLNNAWMSIPTFNETVFSAKDYLNIPRDCGSDLMKIQNAIAKYGLELYAVRRRSGMLVIRETSNHFYNLN